MAISHPTDEPFIPECEMFYEGDTPEALYYKCRKNPGHKNFFPVSGLKMEDHPLEIRSEEMLKYIKIKSQRVVKITVSYTSPHRPNTWPGTDIPYPYSELGGNSSAVRTGTGYIHFGFEFGIREQGPCPCRECDQSEQRKDEYWKIPVHTARHVVFDELEAKNTTCQLFYMTEDKQGVKEIYGIDFSFLKYEVNADACPFHCVTHNKDLVDYLHHLRKKLENKVLIKQPFIISHPHGRCQQITFGKIVYKTRLKKDLDSEPPACIFDDESIKCRLPLFPWSKYNHQGSHDPGDYVVTNDLTVTPGTEFSIPLRQAIPPHDAKYLCCTDYTKEKKTRTFPEGTQFYTDSHQILFFPPEAEFLCNDYISFYQDGEEVDEYVTYDIDTCNGSSGAPVQTKMESLYYCRVHCGARADGYNRSTTIGDDVKPGSHTEDKCHNSSLDVPETNSSLDVPETSTNAQSHLNSSTGPPPIPLPPLE